jgi:hypothetical protein
MPPVELVLRHPNDGPVQGMKDVVAIVVCEEPATAPRACALLSRVGRDAAVEGRLIYSWWTFGVLASASLRQLAASEAAAADIVIIATREGPGLPESVKNWINLWLATGEYHHRPRALVALLEPAEKKNGASRGVLAELKSLAETDGVDFFANGDDMGWEAALARELAPPPGNSSFCARGWGTRIAGRSGRGADRNGANIITRQPSRREQEQDADNNGTTADVKSP